MRDSKKPYPAVPATLLLIALSPAAHAVDVVVCQTDDFSRAVSKLRPGDALVLSDGEWQDVDWVFQATGTPQQPITLRAQTPGRVVIRGHSRLRIAGQHLVVAGLYFRRAWHEDAVVQFRKDSRRLAQGCRLTDCALIDCNPPDRSEDSKYVSVYGRGNRIDHCRIEGKTNRGTTVVVWLGDQPSEHRVDHNYFGPRPELKTNGGETIRVGDSKTSLTNARNLIEFNLFEQCNGEAEIISNKSCENIYRDNTFRRCAGALTLRHGHRCTVEGNFFLGEKGRRTGGVRIIGEDHRVVNNYFAELEGDETRAALSIMNGVPDTPLAGYSQVKRAIVAFNTFVQCKHPLTIGLKDEDAETTLRPVHCLIANNLVLGRRGPFVELLSQPRNTVWQGNIFFGAPAGTKSAGIRIVDPRLSRTADDELYRPQADSPALGAAQGNFPEITADIDGQARAQPQDVGCDQKSAARKTRSPLTDGDVGPSWGGG